MPRMVESPTRFVFTQKLLDAVGPHDADSPSAQLELCDALCIGLRLMVGKTTPPRRTWIFRYRWRDRKCALTLGPYESISLKQARDRVFELKGLLARGENPAEAKRARATMPTFKEFADEQYLPHARATVRRPDVIESRLRTGALPYFRDRPLDSITRRDVTLFMNHMKEKTSATTANHHFILVKRMMNLALQWEVITKTPCAGVKKFKEPSGRDRYLSKDEVNRFLEATYACPNAVAASLFRLLLFSGIRYGEAVTLRFDAVCGETKSIQLVQTKAGKPRRVYLSSMAWAEVERRMKARDGDHPFVFPGRLPNAHLTQPKKPFAWVLDKAKINDFRLHDLRHTFASHMVQSGATLFEVQKSLGHASSQMSQRYSHLSEAGLRDRAESAGQRLIGADTEAQVQAA